MSLMFLPQAFRFGARSVFIAVAACVFLGSSTAQTTKPLKKLTPKEIYAKWSKAVVTVEANDGKTGTGFFDDKGRLFTAFHVVSGCSKVKIVFLDGRTLESGRFLAVLPEKDVAVLSVSGSVSLGPKILRSASKVAVGDAATVIGSPEGLTGSLTTGHVSSKRTMETNKYLQISTSVSHGSSGSPVFNENGDVMGMVVSILEEGQNLNFAVSADELSGAIGVPMSAMNNRKAEHAYDEPDVAEFNAAAALSLRNFQKLFKKMDIANWSDQDPFSSIYKTSINLFLNRIEGIVLICETSVSSKKSSVHDLYATRELLKDIHLDCGNLQILEMEGKIKYHLTSQEKRDFAENIRKAFYISIDADNIIRKSLKKLPAPSVG